MKTILITCGETSGDHHASRLVRELKEAEPSCRVLALGGDNLAAAGAEILFPLEKFAFMGFSEIITALPRVLALERSLKRLLGRGRVDLFIPVDYPGMNLRLSRYAGKRKVPVLYFISPQVWAWGRWRLRRMKAHIDLMAVILPFEERIYQQAGIPVFFAGHPLLDEVEEPARPKQAPGREDAFTVMLFPGSRRQEVDRLLPPLLAAASLIRREFPRCRFQIGLAPLIGEEELSIPADLAGAVEFTREGIAGLKSASLVLAASGTVTLQTALSGTPAVVVYRTSPFTYALGKNLVKIPWIAMPNVLAEKSLLPELIQNQVVPSRIAAEAVALLSDPPRYALVSGELLALRRRLDNPGGLNRLARTALKMAAGEKPESSRGEEGGGDRGA
ncbi:MAG: lipid-A-disaccharide synthase [Candidatus Krumholzibacteriota bacterium]|nr:lipid-A-disaccharide synthase [Candidatus Krumholzibacteriota bacterium]